MIDKHSKKIICTAFAKGRCHDFRLFKDSKIRINPKIKVITDSGYIGIHKIHKNSIVPKKKSNKNHLTNEDKENNKKISHERVINENIIGSLKRFKIIADKYRNRRKRFSLRFNLIAAIYNKELIS